MIRKKIKHRIEIHNALIKKVKEDKEIDNNKRTVLLAEYLIRRNEAEQILKSL